jgi:hypothetical protein
MASNLNIGASQNGSGTDIGASQAAVPVAPVVTEGKSFIFDDTDSDGLGVSKFIKSKLGRSSGSSIIKNFWIPAFACLLLLFGCAKKESPDVITYSKTTEQDTPKKKEVPIQEKVETPNKIPISW